MRTMLLGCLVVLALVFFISCQEKEEELILDHSLSQNCSQLIFEIADLNTGFHVRSNPTFVYRIKDENVRTNVMEILLNNQEKLHRVIIRSCIPAAEILAYDEKKKRVLIFCLDGSLTTEIIEILNNMRVNPVGKSTNGGYGVDLSYHRRAAVPSKRFMVAHGVEMTEAEFAKIIQHKSKLSDTDTATLAVTVTADDSLAPGGMVLISAGTNSGTDPEEGKYSLTVEAFYMDATEVTKAQWDEVYNWAVSHGYSFTNAGSGKVSSHPVHTVDWFDCVKWCNARSKKEGKTPCYNLSDWSCNFSANGYRLPTNTEWEYAARGGLSNKRFPWGDTITHSQANYYSFSSSSYDVSPKQGCHPTYATGGYPYTSPAGAFASNGYGLYDMVGNVWEWCNDASGAYRYNRGGSWDCIAYCARCRYSFMSFPLFASSSRGFRTVRR